MVKLYYVDDELIAVNETGEIDINTLPKGKFKLYDIHTDELIAIVFLQDGKIQYKETLCP
jgi:hypothetical protein